MSRTVLGSGPITRNCTGIWKLLDTSDGLSWFKTWLSTNHGFQANTYYSDTLGRNYWGDPATILNYFATGILPTEMITEGVFDIYPVPSLMSGTLVARSPQ